MPGVVKRRTRNSSGGQQQLISQVVAVEVSLPASKRSRKSTVLDSDQEKVSADKSLLVECLTLMQEGQDMMGTQQGNIPRLILSAVRWLDKIVSGDGLAEKMVEILDATSKYQQVEVISALPEIIPDQHHATIALHLQKMLGER